jgi:hypothetical protein
MWNFDLPVWKVNWNENWQRELLSYLLCKFFYRDFHFVDSFDLFLSLSLSPVRCFYLYRTRRIPTKQHFQITVTRHERNESIVATNKHVTNSTQTMNLCRSVMHRHTCTCESRKFSVEEKRNVSTFHASHDFILEYSTDSRIFMHVNGGSKSSNRLLHFVPRASCGFWQMAIRWRTFNDWVDTHSLEIPSSSRGCEWTR